jgi:MFS transporter, OFA family, oxalate/formate antiporter
MSGSAEAGSPAGPAGKIFYGWRVAGACFLNLFAIVGIIYYSFPVFYSPLIQEFGWSRAQVTAGFAVSIVVIGPLFGVLGGILIDRFGPKRILLFGLFAAGAAFAGYGFMSALWMFYLLYFMQTAGYVTAGPIPNQVLISRWFDRWRGRAMALAYVGAGVGGALAPVLAQFLISNIGWRGAMHTISGGILLVLVPVSWLVIRNHPRDLGLLPDGKPTPSGQTAVPQTKESLRSLREVFRRREFWLIALGSFLSIGAVGGLIQHFVLFLRDRGLAAEKAAGVASFLLVASILGRVIMGWLADRIPKKYVMFIAFSAVAGAVPLLYAGDVANMAYVFAFVFGFGMGADYMMIPLVTAECFGVRSLGKLMGIIITTDSLGQAFTPVIVGRLFDINRNYNLGFALIAAMAIAGAVTVLFIRPERAQAKLAEPVAEPVP